MPIEPYRRYKLCLPIGYVGKFGLKSGIGTLLFLPNEFSDKERLRAEIRIQDRK